MAPPHSSRESRPSDSHFFRAICARFGDKPDALVEILHAIQERDGHVPVAAARDVADALNISRAEVHGVLTFYHDFRDETPGRHVVKLCRAESCQAMGCRSLEDLAKEKLGIGFHETTEDRRVTLDPVYCFGNCALSPAVMVDGELHGRVTPAKLGALLAALE